MGRGLGDWVVQGKSFNSSTNVTKAPNLTIWAAARASKKIGTTNSGCGTAGRDPKLMVIKTTITMRKIVGEIKMVDFVCLVSHNKKQTN